MYFQAKPESNRVVLKLFGTLFFQKAFLPQLRIDGFSLLPFSSHFLPESITITLPH